MRARDYKFDHVTVGSLGKSGASIEHLVFPIRSVRV
jgi:hypothetical protein